MNAGKSLFFATIGLGCIALTLAAAPPPPSGAAVVAADHRLASEAGVAVIDEGGNAIDAAVAAALAGGVVNPGGSGLGGGGFALVRVEGQVFALDFREVAPAGAHRDLYRTPEGGVHPTASRQGGLAVAVPGEPVGLAELVRRFGDLPLSRVVAPAIELAARGFVVEPFLAGGLKRTQYAEIQALFSIDGRVAEEGDLVKRPALAKALQRYAASEGRSFHEGPGAAAIVRAATETGGNLQVSDLAAYRPVERTPISGAWRGRPLHTFPPPSSGGIFLHQVLRALEAHDLRALGHNSTDYVHVVTEAMKHAFADRAHHLGDPAFVTIPQERLLSTERIEAIQRAFWPSKTLPPEKYGPLFAPPQDAGTHHISTFDRHGNAVALTTTINTSFGSGVVVEELGIILNNEMDDFAAAPGVPNAFGLIGAEANAIAPGKRPLSSMTPTILEDGAGGVALVIGASGGSTILSSTLQALLNVEIFGMDPQEAVAAPRFHHQWQPDELVLEPGFAPEVVAGLRARGHVVVEREGYAAVQVVKIAEGRASGGADPRKGGIPAATR